jgi:2-phospho-L-lactate guanylyltransferase
MVWVILPVKGFDKSKQRLAQVLSSEQRQRLSQAMLKDVLQAVTEATEVEHVLVVTKNKDIADLALQYHAHVLLEPKDCIGLNQAVSLGVRHAQIHGGRQAIVLHADIPLVNTKDLSILIRNHLEGGVSLIPDKHQQGTNGLMLDLPIDIEFMYGEGSYQKHLQQFREKGLVCDIAELVDLTLDIDSPEDLLELALQLIEKTAPATEECLRAIDMQKALMDIRSEQ